jgi:hypothetical protein
LLRSAILKIAPNETGRVVKNKKAGEVWTGDYQTLSAFSRLAWDRVNLEVPGCYGRRLEEPHP